MKRFISLFMITVLVVATVFTTGCSSKNNKGADTTDAKTTDANKNKNISGSIQIDGSSTVYPITAAAAEGVKQEYPKINVSVAYAGTGGGMKKFSNGEIPICDASRPIEAQEIEACKAKGIEYNQFKIAYDGITIVVNKDNTWAKEMTVDELKKMWKPDSEVKTWKDINPKWPDEKITFYSPGADSGTFEYFTEAIVGEKKKIRKDITPSEDDNTLVKGVEGDKYSIGYFGYAYYVENKDKLNDIKVNAGGKAVGPTVETIKDGSYKPLSRPLFLYVDKKKQEEKYIKAFLEYYLKNGDEIVKLAKYVPLDDYTEELNKLK